MDAELARTSVTESPLTWTEAVCQWLCTLLAERFGISMQLVFDEVSRRWRLSMQGDLRGITVDGDPDVFLRADSGAPCAIWNAKLEGWCPVLDEPLPAPGVAFLPAPLIDEQTHGYLIRYDIFGLVYWMLTRQEEVGQIDTDEHGRFFAKISHAYRNKYLERPIIDEWLDILGQVIQRTWPLAGLKRPRFEIKISHDVDIPSRYGFCGGPDLARRMAGDLIRRRDLRGLAGLWIRFNTRRSLHRLDPFNTFDWLMEVSEQHGLSSAFYFICDRRGTPYDSDYDVAHPAIRALIRKIHLRGHEIGLHPSYGTYRDALQIRREADRLRQVCAEEGVKQERWGGRMHYLQWRQPDTLQAWSDAGMAYDSTLTYADRPGFRCGTSFEYQAFDPVEHRVMQLRIRPLVVMEGAVFGERYMGLGVTSTALDKMLKLKTACRKVGGVFSLLWHNSAVQTEAERRLYKAVVGG